ncbi:MAG: chromate resistance protein ChrB domain-containing protein [Candidatus Heimdallarchaeota archaeon]
MIWVTRDYVHVDRVACPWLIKRFIDEKAQFVFLPRDEIAPFVEKTGAIPYDSGVGDLDHYKEDGVNHCTFDALIKEYKLKDEVLELLRKVVRAADTNKFEEEPLALGLEAIACGAPLLTNSDHEALEMEFPFYDALYAYLQQDVIYKKYPDEIKKLATRGERQAFVKEKMKEW